MLPVLLSIGSFSLSSFGLFLALAFLFGVFLVWRLSRAWDLDEEKVLDLTLLTFFGGVIGARIYFILEHISFFNLNFIKWLHILKYPGFSFWGAFLGGWLTLYFFSRRKRLDFWTLADLGSIGFLGGLIFASLGCFFGGCSVGIVSNIFLAVPMIGQVGKRFPTQALEALLFSYALIKIWSKATHFHFRGKIVILSLLYIGLIKLLTQMLRQVSSEGYLFSISLIILSITIFYKLQGGKRTPVSDLKLFISYLIGFIIDRKMRKMAMDGVKKYWYNQKTQTWWRIKNFTKALRRSRVKFSHRESKLY